MAQKMANGTAKPDSLPLNLGAAMTDGSTAGKVEVAGGSDRSISPEERSKTPDSGPNNDDEIVSESDSRKDASGTDPDGSPSSSLQKQSGMVEFVVDDFMEHIKEGGMYSSSSAFNLAPVDPRVLENLEHLISKLCENVVEMDSYLTEQMQQMCQLTAEHVRVYRSGIEKTCDNVDICIKTIYQLMARTEELHKQMRNISAIQEQVKEIKRMVTILEGYVDSL
ncbi:hypothetical protein RvY_05298-2 [Ramazzottius varieornatus]|uniref:BLOC-1-related complex subunit 6 C-terminal helix domain-containing protein n=1 Tax=Ramazzottius varieornatus TaxID=947166 RepID=A0A1D1V3J6_RAMVA|nr:hypothetical protein RvY_05298-2 [Ramazzottius varieornatus]